MKPEPESRDTARGAEHVPEELDRRADHAAGGVWIRQKTRKQMEEIFGWIKTVGMMRKMRHRGKAKVG